VDFECGEGRELSADLRIYLAVDISRTLVIPWCPRYLWKKTGWFLPVPEDAVAVRVEDDEGGYGMERWICFPLSFNFVMRQV